MLCEVPPYTYGGGVQRFACYLFYYLINYVLFHLRMTNVLVCSIVRVYYCVCDHGAAGADGMSVCVDCR